MKTVTLDPAKMLGFRVAQTDSGRIGLKLGQPKEGVVAAAPTWWQTTDARYEETVMTPVTLDPAKLLGFRIAQEADTRIGLKLGFDKSGTVKK